MAYAEKTDVPAARSQQQLVDLLKKHKAEQVAIGWSEAHGQAGFQLGGRVYKVTVPMAKPGRGVNVPQVERARWRTLLLVVKAKLEAVDAGITTIEQEFLSNTVLPDGSTVFEQTQQTIERAYVEGHVRPLLELGR
jgi:hypothetical protein